jgi:hypothetical protein
MAVNTIPVRIINAALAALFLRPHPSTTVLDDCLFNR